MNQTTDHELMVAVARGDLASMSEIYQRRHRALFQFFFRLTGQQSTAEDLVHDVFLRMIRHRHTYRAGDSFEAWMYRIARNTLSDQVKRHRLEVAPVEGEMEAVESDSPTAYEDIAKRQNLQLLYRALRELPAEKRELLVLCRFQGLSYEEMGRILGCEAGTVKVRVYRAMKEMGRIFEDLQKEKAS